MTVEPERIARLLETSLTLIWNDLEARTNAEYKAAQAEIGNGDFKKAQEHMARASAFLEACLTVHQQIIEINREVSDVAR